MPRDTLQDITTLLEEALEVHRSVRCVVLSTKEGVVVAALSREEEFDAPVLATVSAAIVWGATTTLGQLGRGRPTHILHDTKIEKILTVIQPHYHLVVLISRADDAGIDVANLLPDFQSLATRMELVMGSTSTFGSQTILGQIVEEFSDITQALLLTTEGLPLGSVGFENHVEVAGLASSIFSNGLTFSKATNTITIGLEQVRLMVTKVDEQRLLVVVCRGLNAEELCVKVKLLLEKMC